MAARRSRSQARSKAAREFVSEVEEILDRMREDLADLADDRAQGELDPDRVNQLFRSAHSLKGIAGMFGFEGMSELAHHLEDILDGLRMGRIPSDSPAVDLLDEAVPLVASLLERAGNEQAQQAAQSEIEAMVARIEGVLQGPAAPAAAAALSDVDDSILRALTEYEEHRLRENLRRGRHVYLVETSFEILSFEEGLAALTDAAREAGEVISTLPAPGDTPESQIRFSLLVASDCPPADFAIHIDAPNVDVRCAHAPREDTSSAPPSAATASTPASTGEARARSEAKPSEVHQDESADRSASTASSHQLPDASTPASTGEARARSGAKPSEVHRDESADHSAATAGSPGHDDEEDVPPAEHVRPAEPPSELESLKSISETVRVDIRKLDELMNLVGELVIQRGAIDAIASRLLGDPATSRIGAELAKVHKALDRKLQDLQAGVLEVRMVPLRQVFEKLSRVVRRLRRVSGKDVRLEIRGGDTELDKLIVEELADPLMHVVRNAFDHAIEPSAERVAAGKPAHGSIRLEALQRGNHVVVQVADDGRGIDPVRVRARGEELGMIAPDQALSRKDALDLTFRAGFSTASKVTETSGRGVGMDVVRENVTALGGLVHLDSAVGRGTVVSFTLPITLAIIQALIVEAGGQRFAIPLTSVLETLLLADYEVQRSEGREVLNLRGDPLPLRRLHAEFGLPGSPPDARQAVVVVGLGDARMGLLVDGLEGQQDAVIKPIQGPARAVRGIAGATELGDRGAVLVLDVAPIVEDAVRQREAA